MNTHFPLITVLGPTAVGKTGFAARLASVINGEIISADSRQVFRMMDIGTGKDRADYIVANKHIPVHLIDIADPGTEFSVFNFKNHFESAYNVIVAHGTQPVLCGGTGLYLESILKGYELPFVPENPELRHELKALSDIELIHKLLYHKSLHNTTDTIERDRLVRAIEIEEYKIKNHAATTLPDFRCTPVLGIRYNRQLNRERITQRLRQRLDTGMTAEVQKLLDLGISAERIKRYGLEYKYVTLYLEGELTFDQMFGLLNTAIHQFAKRQMTWFRRMENHGLKIHWLEGENGLESNLAEAIYILDNQSSG